CTVYEQGSNGCIENSSPSSLLAPYAFGYENEFDFKFELLFEFEFLCECPPSSRLLPVRLVSPRNSFQLLSLFPTICRSTANNSFLVYNARTICPGLVTNDTNQSHPITWLKLASVVKSARHYPIAGGGDFSTNIRPFFSKQSNKQKTNIFI
ncbi:unnamed protein product, partial [Nesidiocoris tenuis]